MSYFWIEVNKAPIQVTDVGLWAEWMESSDRIVQRTYVGETMVSTVFLGMDHNWPGEGPAILYETLVFDGPMGGELCRYTSRDAAEAGHEAMVKRVQEAQQG